MRDLLTEPLARDLELGTPEAAVAQRRILASKPALHRAYELVYRRMLAAAREQLADTGGARLEIGSGGGFLAELDGRLTTSDVTPIPGIDLVLDARELPFEDASVDVVFAMHVLHHVPDVRRFLHELERCLVDGGGLVAVEPYWSPVARLLYTRFHPEPFDLDAQGWEFESSGPFSSNQALSHLLLVRDRGVLEREFPALEVLRGERFGGPSYVLTGGIWKRPLLPSGALVRLADWEERHRFWEPAAALHHLFVLRRRPRT